MKKLVLVAALALLAVAPVAATEISPSAPTVTLDQIFGASTPPRLQLAKPPLVPRCSAVTGTCTNGTTTPCTDACNNQLSCTCFNHAWFCDQEC